MKILLGSV